MENITLGYIVSAIGIIGVLIGAIASVVKPVEKFKGYDTRIDNLEKDTEQIMLSINCMLSHFVDGNHTAQLKQRKAELDEYLIKR